MKYGVGRLRPIDCLLFLLEDLGTRTTLKGKNL